MIFERLPKITKVEGGASPLSSPEFVLNNYRVVAFIIDNSDENELTVKVKANTEGGTAENIPFLFKANTDTEYEKIEATGKTLSAGGVYVAAITADALGRKELDRVSIELTSAESINTVFVIQTQPRYNE